LLPPYSDAVAKKTFDRYIIFTHISHIIAPAAVNSSVAADNIENEMCKKIKCDLFTACGDRRTVNRVT